MIILRNAVLMGVTGLMLAACADDIRRVESSSGYNDSSRYQQGYNSEATVRDTQSK